MSASPRCADAADRRREGTGEPRPFASRTRFRRMMRRLQDRRAQPGWRSREPQLLMERPVRGLKWHSCSRNLESPRPAAEGLPKKMSPSLPRYDPTRSYDWNYEHAPEPAPVTALPPVPG